MLCLFQLLSQYAIKPWTEVLGYTRSSRATHLSQEDPVSNKLFEGVPGGTDHGMP